MSKQKLSIFIITTGAFLSFFIFGFMDNIKGPAIPVLLKDLGFTYSQGGTILFSQYAGFLIATLLTGVLAGIVGRKNIIVLAMLFLGIGAVGFTAFSSLFLLTLFMLALGFGLGAIEVGANAIIVDIHHLHKGRYLNLLAFFHGFGGMVAPIYTSALLIRYSSWRIPYKLTIYIVIAMLVYFIIARYPKNIGSNEDTKIDYKKVFKNFFNSNVILFNILICVYVMAEIGLAGWVVEFLQKVKMMSVGISSFFLTLFFGTMTLGRLLGSFIVDRIGHLKMLLISIIGSIICIALGIFGPSYLAFFLPLTGLFFSIIFPTTTAAFSERNKENFMMLMALLFAFAGAGGMLGPWLIGILSDIVGIKYGFSFILAYCVVMLVSIFFIMREKLEKN